MKTIPGIEYNNAMEPGPKGNKYFAPPGSIPKLGQRVWSPDEDRQLQLLMSYFPILSSDTIDDIKKKRKRFFRIWRDHLRTGEHVVIPN